MARRADEDSTGVRLGGLGGPKQRGKRHFDWCSKRDGKITAPIWYEKLSQIAATSGFRAKRMPAILVSYDMAQAFVAISVARSGFRDGCARYRIRAATA